jgi:hypothetical protein|tara:strand:+ start:518 stop:619 length:102 start_codon:yes stop_codon:yes gene_type:complete
MRGWMDGQLDWGLTEISSNGGMMMEWQNVKMEW